MGKLVNALSGLAGNILGGKKGSANYNYGGGYHQARKSAIELRQDNPLSPMENDPFAFSSISYPQDLSNHAQMGHYILFYINVQDKTTYLYKGYKDGKSVDVGGQLWKTISKAQVAANPELKNFGVKEGSDYSLDGGTQKPDYTEGLINRSGGTNIMSDKVNLTTQGRGAKVGMETYRKTTTRITDSIALYLPPNVQDNYSVNYNASATGMLGFLAATVGGGIGAWNNNDMDKLSRIVGDGLFGFVDYAFKKAALSSAEFLTSSEGGEELWNKAFGKADNPYLEVLFEAPQLREFTYNFTFAPRNKPERDQVQKIIQMFKFHMAPELRTDHNRFLTLPSTFDIHYMYQGADGKNSENDYYNRIATCVLKNCATDYTPGGVRSHADGSPVQMKMALTFQETEMITKQHIDEGY
tara:strand:- start:276 stop:1511 length:1236 start_codon:yes stop_codon:yes gene_type:complete